MTIAEKIMARAAGKAKTKPGEYLDCKLDGILAIGGMVETHQGAIDAGVLDGLPQVFDKSKIFMMVEHNQPAGNAKTAGRAVMLREFAERYDIEHFHDVSCGICHQMMVDNAYALPGQMVVGTDSHTIMYGALNCAATGYGETEAAYATTFGEMWFQVPPTIRIELTGEAPPWPCGKDIMLHLAGKYGVAFARYKSIEFVGPGVKTLSMDNRFCMADHGIEVGAKFTFFEVDEITREYLKGRTSKPFEAVKSDPDAQYERVIKMNLSELVPQIAVPHSFGNNKPIKEVLGTRIDQACVGSCANGRFEDIEMTARIVKGRKVAKGVRLLVSPGSWEIYRRCLKAGLQEIILEAGGQFLHPGCGICGGSSAFMAPGEVCITATTRNHQGRMGSREAFIYLGSPATVAWSAVNGEISDPRDVLDKVLA